jgi:hypothetical protein
LVEHRPLAEKYLDMSPYHYVKSNPISNIDIKGGWAISVHYMMTLQALKSYGMTNKRQLDILSNYTSVFADNPGSKTLDGNNFIFGVGVTKKSSINYDLTVNSQELHWEKNSRHENFNIWHSMQSDWEYDNNQITDEAAMQRGMSFGWSKIFKAAESGVSLDDMQENSSEIQRFGQGVHALQDAYAHKGVNWGRHSTFNDIYGDTKEAMSMTKSAIQVYKLMTNDFKGLGDSVKGIKLDGMSKKQQEQVFKKIQEFLSSQNDNGKK